MCGGGSASAAHNSDLLARFYFLIFSHQNFSHVGIARDKSILVFDRNKISVGTKFSGINHPTRARGIDGITTAATIAQINAGVKATAARAEFGKNHRFF